MTKDLTREQVIHVAKLGKLELTEEELQKYPHQLGQILDEIEKIINLDIKEDNIMISPTDNKNCYFNGDIKDMLKIEEVLKNAPKTNGNYVEIPKVLND